MNQESTHTRESVMESIIEIAPAKGYNALSGAKTFSVAEAFDLACEELAKTNNNALKTVRELGTDKANLSAEIGKLRASLFKMTTWAETYARNQGIDVRYSTGPLASDIDEAQGILNK